MQSLKICYYQGINNKWVGWLEQFPDFKIQSEDLEDLKKNLSDVYEDLAKGKIK
jgi:predicted secreted protein